MDFKHVSVLLDETIEGLNINPDGIYFDGTLGGGGHSEAIAKQLTTGRLIGIDQDADAIRAAGERLAPYGERVTLIQSNYEAMSDILDTLRIERVDGIMLDLGVSSFQLDTAERGFSYMEDAPLDMRMSREGSRTAADVVNGYTEDALYRVIRDYGEEPFAKNIAKHIVRERETKPIETTLELVDIIKGAIPAKARRTGGHPAKQTFQAIRIEVNRELEVLQNSVDGMIRRLAPGGRICIITFHSLEDRIVKQIFRKNESPCICPPEFPVCMCKRRSLGTVITKKPILPSEEETERNRRAKSAKLRIFERNAEPATWQ